MIRNIFNYLILLIAIASCGLFARGKNPEVSLQPSGKWHKAVFAGGCFWCMEPPFEKLKGVKDAISGYSGGKEKNPSYEDVAYGRTGHAESVMVLYDPAVISYEKLVDVFFRNIDPTQKNGQFVDTGTQYRTAIFYKTSREKSIAEKKVAEINKSARFSKPVVTEITRAGSFYRAEEYHQDFYKKQPGHYKRYRNGSGRDGFINKYWK